MKLFFISILCVLGICMACGGAMRPPKDLIKEKEMVLVIWDMSLAEEFVTTYVMKDSSKVKDDEIQKQYAKVFAYHHINRDQFTRSFNYYRSDPQMFKRLMDSSEVYAKIRKQDVYKNEIIKFQ